MKDLNIYVYDVIFVRDDFGEPLNYNVKEYLLPIYDLDLSLLSGNTGFILANNSPPEGSKFYNEIRKLTYLNPILERPV